MIIIGQGRVGSALVRRATDHGAPCIGVDRNNGWDAIDSDEFPGPILVTTNAGDLSEVIHKVPSDRKSDLAFIQNGMIDDELRSHGLQDNVRGLLYFAVAARGADISPGAASIFTGGQASIISEWLQNIAITADVVPKSRFTNEMLSKLIWNCVFGLLCDVYNSPVGALVKGKRPLIDSLVAELSQVGARGIGATLDPSETSANLCDYSLSISDYQGSLKQWEWRNGWFVEAATKHRVKTPHHMEMLRLHSNNPACETLKI